MNSRDFQGQRTVYRLTIVKAWNNEEIEAYADLVQVGTPDFIEIKGIACYVVVNVVDLLFIVIYQLYLIDIIQVCDLRHSQINIVQSEILRVKSTPVARIRHVFVLKKEAVLFIVKWWFWMR